MAEVNANSDSLQYLHGDLDLKILKGRGFEIPSDTYVTVLLGDFNLARTRTVVYNSGSPEWNEHFQIPLAHPVFKPELRFNLQYNDYLNNTKSIGTTSVSVQQIVTGEAISHWFPCSGKQMKPDAAIFIEVKFTNCEDTPLYQYGIASDPDNFGVHDCRFPVRKGGSVTLYQDAHVPDSMLPEIKLQDGKVFEHEKCWEDMCHAILEAEKVVYIVGWSIYHKVKLVREPTRPLPSAGNLNLGDLLKHKSKQGVRVLLLLWNDVV
nr:isoform 2 of phospholipase d delta [Quercus suber]